MLKEFQDFALRGNVVDLAVGVVIGGAFGKIVDAVVNGVLMPVVGLLTGGIDFSKQAITLTAAKVVDGKEIAPVLLSYGTVISTIIQFAIVAFFLFMVIKAMNNLKKKEEAAPAAPPRGEVLLEEIRDLLKR